MLRWRSSFVGTLRADCKDYKFANKKSPVGVPTGFFRVCSGNCHAAINGTESIDTSLIMPAGCAGPKLRKEPSISRFLLLAQ